MRKRFQNFQKKALIVDSSALVRRILSKIVENSGLKAETAKNGTEAIEKALKKNYEVIIVNIETPDKNGFQLIKKIMEKKPTKIIVISDNTIKDESLIFEAFKLGVISVITKSGKGGISLQEIKDEISMKINEILKIPKFRIITKKAIYRKNITNNVETKATKYEANDDIKYILIGASTGGPGLIETIAKNLPENYPYPLCVVQHMPVSFTKKFAERLDTLSKIKVVEASNGEAVSPGKMIIGKGGWHLHFSKKITDGTIVCKLSTNIHKRYFVPSVDEMFFSALEVMDPSKIVAILLTGIGDDGAEGMVALKRAGAYTIAESEETAIVYGMPKEAQIRGGATKVLPFPEILNEILKIGKKRGI